MIFYWGAGRAFLALIWLVRIIVGLSGLIRAISENRLILPLTRSDDRHQ